VKKNAVTRQVGPVKQLPLAKKDDLLMLRHKFLDISAGHNIMILEQNKEYLCAICLVLYSSGC
jgi:hypothetical protein